MKAKKVSESRTTTTQVVYPNDVNNNGTLYGGRLLDWIDAIGGVVAKRHCRSPVVTASIDSLSFLNPIHQQDIVNLEAWMNYVGHSSMEVEVRVTSENPFTAETSKTCRAFITYVAMDDKGEPREVPRLILESEEDKRNYAMAKERRENRLGRRHLEPIEW